MGKSVAPLFRGSTVLDMLHMNYKANLATEQPLTLLLTPAHTWSHPHTHQSTLTHTHTYTHIHSLSLSHTLQGKWVSYIEQAQESYSHTQNTAPLWPTSTPTPSHHHTITTLVFSLFVFNTWNTVIISGSWFLTLSTHWTGVLLQQQVHRRQPYMYSYTHYISCSFAEI